MAVYSKADLISAKASVSVLKNDIQDSITLSNSIKGFCDESINILKGDSWDLIRTNLSDYIDILSLRQSIANELIGVIESVNNDLLLALGDYSEIDTDHLEEQQTLYNQCKSSIENLKSSVTVDNDALEYYNNMMNQVNEMINQINEVKNVEQSSLSSLEQVANSLISYSSKVEDIPVPVITYTEAL